MNYAEFRSHLGKAGVTVNGYAALLHVRPSSISNYAKKGIVPHTHAIIAVALREAADNGNNLFPVLARYGVRSEQSTRGRSAIEFLIAAKKNVVTAPGSK